MSAPPPTRSRPTVIVADDYPGILAAFARLLEGPYDIVAACADGLALVDAALQHKTDVVVSDMKIPLLNGLAACRRIRRALPDTSVILFSATDDDGLKARAIDAGAAAFVLKTRATDDLLPAIAAALARPGR